MHSRNKRGCAATASEIVMMNCVDFGRVVPKSLNIFVSVGTTSTSMSAPIRKMAESTMAGYMSAPRTFLLSL